MCPNCRNALSVVPSDPSNPSDGGDGAVPISSIGVPQFLLSCSHCRWDSAEIGIAIDQPGRIAKQLQKLVGSPSDEHFEPAALGTLKDLGMLLFSQHSKQCPVCTHFLIKPQPKVQSGRYGVKSIATKYLPGVTVVLPEANANAEIHAAETSLPPYFQQSAPQPHSSAADCEADEVQTASSAILEKKANVTVVEGEVGVAEDLRGSVKFHMRVAYTYPAATLVVPSESNGAVGTASETEREVESFAFLTVVDLGLIVSHDH
ncbi:hypothetical protein K438DRAFT_2118809 [Mycena galopus ATCC 62051]|nr:hypothetical protein K438DRAFT_2118809 [Mycena galopus ATCC 62051]